VAPSGAGSDVLEGGEGARFEYRVRVGPQARFSQPYWVRERGIDRFRITVPQHATLPWSPPDVVAELSLTSGAARATLRRAAHYAYEGVWVGGQKEKVVAVVPALGVSVSPEVAVVPLPEAGPREFRVRVLNNRPGPTSARVRLEAPQGWSVEPETVALGFELEAEAQTARFVVEVPSGTEEGDFEVRAVAVGEGREYREGYRIIAYNHIQQRHLFQPARAAVRTIRMATAPGARVGYVEGVGDRVPAAIEQLGFEVERLTPDQLAEGDLSRYSTIVTGVRAYQVAGGLKAHHQRLSAFVRDGGHLVVQYNKLEFNQPAPWPSQQLPGCPPAETASPFAPYPAVVTRDRISVEQTPVAILKPDHALMTTPNRITETDFEGWVQEIGLYLLGARDPRYVELLSATDPWPENPGEKRGLLVTARVGKGTWTYVGLGLWRQLPAGTRGAYRLLANLIRASR
jgi:hypothetical protein